MHRRPRVPHDRLSAQARHTHTQLPVRQNDHWCVHTTQTRCWFHRRQNAEPEARRTERDKLRVTLRTDVQQAKPPCGNRWDSSRVWEGQAGPEEGWGAPGGHVHTPSTLTRPAAQPSLTGGAPSPRPRAAFSGPGLGGGASTSHSHPRARQPAASDRCGGCATPAPDLRRDGFSAAPTGPPRGRSLSKHVHFTFAMYVKSACQEKGGKLFCTVKKRDVRSPLESLVK